jgi:alpha-beta hydrolase superfamily lysophospholipase
MTTRNILFITGAFVSHTCWDDWRQYFESKGFATAAPAWPHKDAPSEALRNRQPDSDIASNRLADLVDYFATQARKFSEPPILIGHSIGGLVAQLLIQRNIGRMAVAIHSVPPQGIMTFKLSFLKSGWRALGFFTPTDESYMMSFKTWTYAFVNGMSCEEQKEAYYKFSIPESKLIVRDTTSKAAHVDFSKPHAPLLFIAGSTDNCIPSSLNYSNYKRYSHAGSVTEFKELKGRNHFVLGQPSWPETAETIHAWITRHN